MGKGAPRGFEAGGVSAHPSGLFNPLWLSPAHGDSPVSCQRATTSASPRSMTPRLTAWRIRSSRRIHPRSSSVRLVPASQRLIRSRGLDLDQAEEPHRERQQHRRHRQRVGLYHVTGQHRQDAPGHCEGVVCMKSTAEPFQIVSK